jgi:ABC-type glycerol-3-phosphate transport system permease component
MRRGLSKIGIIILFAVLCLTALSTAYPLIFMIYNSFKTEAEYTLGPLQLPEKMRLHNYVMIYKSYNILKLFKNTLIIVSFAIAIEIFTCSLAAYAFAKSIFKGKNVLFLFFVSMMIVPFQVLMLPLYIMFAKFHLINTKIAMIIIYSGVLIPFALYFLTVNFKTIPNEILEAARIDGASYFRIFWSLILPIGRSAIITLFILDFIWLWNELVLGLIFLQSDETKTITVGVATILGGQSSRNLPLLLTGLFLSSLPLFILYCFAARFIMKEIIVGAVKG